MSDIDTPASGDISGDVAAIEAWRRRVRDAVFKHGRAVSLRDLDAAVEIMRRLAREKETALAWHKVAASERDELRAERIDLIIRDIAELPDRTSPDDWPEAMLVTPDELRSIIQNRMPDATEERDRLRTLITAVATQIRVAHEKHGDAPMAAQAHYEEALGMLADHAGEWSPECAKLRDFTTIGEMAREAGRLREALHRVAEAVQEAMASSPD